MEIEFKSKNDKQILAAGYWIDDSTEEILYGGAKGGGKSYLGAFLICADALLYPGTHYFIARHALIDLRKFTVPTVYEVIRNLGLKFDEHMTYNDQDHVFKFKNGSQVFLIDCKEIPSDPMFERFGSMQMTRGWIEEAGEVAEAAKANLWLSIGRWKNKEYNLKKKLLMTANPKKGWMKREFVDLFNQGILHPERKYIQAFATDNTYLPEDYVKSLKNEKDKVRRQRLYEGNWDYAEDQDQLVSFDALTDAFSNTIVKENEKYLIIDVARFGDDSTTFNFWQGLELYRIEMRQKQDTEQTKQQARDFAAAEKIPYSHIMIDEDGIGGAIVDGMFGTKGFIANSTPLPTKAEIRERVGKVDNYLIPKRNFKNLKTQCAYKLAELINEHKVAFKVPDFRDTIIEELSALLRVANIDSDGKLEIKPKSEVKEDLARSPDIGDPIIYRAWFELKRDASLDDPGTAEIVKEQRVNMARNRENKSVDSSK